MFGCRGHCPGQAAAALCTGGTMSSSHYWLELIVCGNMQISQRTRSPSDVRLILILADSFVTPQADAEITSLVPQLQHTTIRFSSSHSAAIRSLHQYLYRSIPGWFVHPWENKATEKCLTRASNKGSWRFHNPLVSLSFCVGVPIKHLLTVG